MISRIIAPRAALLHQKGSERRLLASKLHDHTFGLTSDPLTLFACAFSALIHDVDHCGVPNSVLIKENGDLAKLYQNKSIAEQNSVDLSWAVLMEDSYADLRAAIFETKDEQDHFRQIVVNCVMATDIMDPNLKADRNKRWGLAFGGTPARNTLVREDDNRKATVVIEHLLQASDIAHTMQHVSRIHMPSNMPICNVCSSHPIDSLTSSGTSTVNGTNDCTRKRLQPFLPGAPTRIPQRTGIRESLDSSIST